MSRIDFNNIVDSVLNEQGSNLVDQFKNPISSSPEQENTNNDSIGAQIEKAMVTWQERIKQDVSTTMYANQDNIIWNDYIIGLGKLYKGKPDANIQKRALDSTVAKYVDMGYQIFEILRREQKMNNPDAFKLVNNYITLNQLLAKTNDQNVLTLIKSFNTPLDTYQCKSPWLKVIVDADNLAAVSLQTLYSMTIYGAIKEMLTKRANALKAQINERNILSVLASPGESRMGGKTYPETFVNTLADNQMYIERIAAIGIAAKEYYKYLVNKKASLNPETQQTQNESNLKFKSFVKNIIFEQNEKQVLRYIPRDIWNPAKWNEEDPNFKKFETEYIQFLKSGTSQYIPGKEEIEIKSQELEAKVKQRTGQPFPPIEQRPTEYTEPLVYTLDVIAQDPSTQAKLLIQALQAIAQYTKTRKTLMQKLKQRGQALKGAAQSIWDLSGQSLYPS